MATKQTIFEQTPVEPKNKPTFKKKEKFQVHLPEPTKNNACVCIENCLQDKKDLWCGNWADKILATIQFLSNLLFKCIYTEKTRSG